eukprot:7787179-Pyramimonas_sp.AAC.1
MRRGRAKVRGVDNFQTTSDFKTKRPGFHQSLPMWCLAHDTGNHEWEVSDMRAQPFGANWALARGVGAPEPF